MERQICNVCKIDKDIKDFEWQKNRPNPRKTCQTCRSKRRWLSIISDSDKHKHFLNVRRIWRIKNREKININWILNNHEFTLEQYQKMLNDQGYLCGLCDNILDMGRNTHIDHDHETGAVRGLICTRCNTGIGQCGDTIGGLLQCVAYLQQYEERLLKE